MQTDIKRLTVPLYQQELAALHAQAKSNVRRPQDQLRYIVLKGLGLVESEEKGKGSSDNVRQDNNVTQPS